MKARLYTKYVNEVVPALKAKHNYANVHQIPRLEKIVVNMGVSASLEKGAIDDAALLREGDDDAALLAGVADPLDQAALDQFGDHPAGLARGTTDVHRTRTRV